MQNQRNKILYVGNFSFPDMNAAGKRVYYNGKVIQSLGYELIFVGTSKEQGVNFSKILKTKGRYQGVCYYNFEYPKTTKDWLKYKSKFKNFVEVIENIGPESIKNIIIYNSPSLSLFNRKLIKYCRKHRIGIISDCTDWLTTSTTNSIFNFVKNTDVWYQRSVLNKKCDSVICISSYLDKYYNRSVPTIIVPPLTEKNSTISLYDESRTIRIIYAGIPFRIGSKDIIRETMKDRLDLTIKFIKRLKEKDCNVIFDIYGMTEEEYLYALPQDQNIIENLNSVISFKGVVDQKEVELKIKEYDYSILLREESRDTLAGVSTKVSESISNGIPVITTNVGDINLYISEGINGIYVDLLSLEDVDSILPYFNSKEKLKQLKLTTMAANPFYWKLYKEKFEKIL